MGEPKFQRRKYETPTHPWKADRILEETGIQRKYGLKNKREVWKAKSMLRRNRKQARSLLARKRTGQAQALLEEKRLLRRMHRLGLLGPQATLDDVLALDVERFLTRRLQTQVYLKGLTGTPKQARQFIAHGHVTVRGVRSTVPGHLVTRQEEETIELLEGSPIADEAHPVRPKRAEAGQAAARKLQEPNVAPVQPFGRGGGGGGRRGGGSGGGSGRGGGSGGGGSGRGGGSGGGSGGGRR
jgi:small subunit ribosomal protein S4